jgi:methionyl-tRNA formyltransferase
VSRAGFRVVFFGTPQFAVPSLEQLIGSSHTVVGVVTQPDRPRGRGQHVTPCPVKAVALAHGLPVWHPARLADDAWLGQMRDLGAEMGIVAAFGRLLPQALLDALPDGFLNVHASLLPRWRGAAPIQRAIMAGDRVTGITIMRVVLALDAGPMLAREEVPIGDDATTETLEPALAACGAGLLVRTLDRLREGPIPEIPQPESDVTYATKLDRAESRIDWTQPAAVIARRVRGLRPWPLAVARHEGRALALLRARVAADPVGTATPGTILRADGEAVVVACGERALAITEVKPEGRRAMAVRDFLNGASVPAGVVLR